MLRYKGSLFPLGHLVTASLSSRDGEDVLTLLWRHMNASNLQAFGIASMLPAEFTGKDARTLWGSLLEFPVFVQIGDVLLNQLHLATWLPHEKDGQFAVTVALSLGGALKDDPLLTFTGDEARKLREVIGNRPMLKPHEQLSNRKSRFLR